MPAEIFVLPVFDKLLLYAPFHHLSALINHQARHDLITYQADTLPAPLRPLADIYTPINIPAPSPTAPLIPFYLGIIPTRGCNIGCRYCDFAAPKHKSPMMTAEMAHEVVDAYLNLLKNAHIQTGQIHFFGGEPFLVPQFVRDVVEYATARADKHHIRLRYEATTNGIFSESVCQWIGETFDAVVLSLDGLPQDHDRHRPTLNGHGTFEMVAKNARILSDSPCELIIRACVTGESITRLPDFAQWIGDNLKPSIACFETLSVSPLAIEAGFTAPNPHDFALYFDHATRILAHFDIQTVTSSADLSQAHTSFCPVSKDALIVSPDGAVDACYLLQTDWQQKGLDMRLGRLNEGVFEIQPDSLARVRAMQVQNRPLCADCMCKFHCAGGCHVHHDTNRPAGQFDNWCIQTRLITITRLLRDLGEDDLADAFLNTPSAWEHAVWQASDRMILTDIP